jgi:CheY-like chemotaxis protein
VTVGILKLLGYTVLEAADGAEALSRSSGHAGAIDLLLTDVAMPGIGGVELARLLLIARPGLRVLYMTGFDPSAAEGDVSGHVAGRTLLRPFTSEDLGRAVREALSEG